MISNSIRNQKFIDFQIVQYKNSSVLFEGIDIDGLKLNNEPLTVVNYNY